MTERMTERMLTAGLALIPSNIVTFTGGYKASRLPSLPLNLWGYESSSFSKVIRETLVELEIPHILRSCARGSPKRHQLYEMTKNFQVSIPRILIPLAADGEMDGGIT
jgi:hypothetical protein